MATDTPARDGLLVKYLNEAYGKEKQLETSLQALIGRAQNHKTLKKGFQDHLKVTKNQARELQRRIKALGGKAEAGPDLPGPDVATTAASAVTNVANRAVAAAKGPVQMLRGTGEADNMLRNVRDAFWNEAEEIGHYNVIETVATKLSDRETAQLAKRFRREEERFQRFLERQISSLAGEVIKQEVPASERRNGTTRRRASSSSRSRSSSNGSSASSRSTASRSTNGSSASRTTTRKKSTGSTSAKRRSAAQKAAATRTRKAAASSAKSTAKSARTTARKAGTTAKKAGRAARSTAKAASRS